MKTLVLIALLTVLHLTASVVILQSSPSSTKIVSPSAATPILSVIYNSGAYANIAGAGVQWITGPTPGTTQLVFESLFYASCIGAGKLKIFGAATFNAYLDGVFVAGGSLLEGFNKQGFDVKLSCGNHNLTVKVSGGANTQEALTFALDQDQSACKCQSNGFWNQQTCSCNCIDKLSTGCSCPKPKVWRDYPTCGCRCPPIYNFPTILSAGVSGAVNIDDSSNDVASAAATAVDRAFAPLCLPPRYYSQDTCSCICHYKYCPPKYYFDVQTCTCFPHLY